MTHGVPPMAGPGMPENADIDGLIENPAHPSLPQFQSILNDYRQTFGDLGLDPRRHGFTFRIVEDGTLQTRSAPHPLWSGIHYERDHTEHSRMYDQVPYLQNVKRLDMLQDTMRGLGMNKSGIPPHLMTVPALLRDELSRRNVSAEWITGFSKNASLPSMIRFGDNGAELSREATGYGMTGMKDVDDGFSTMIVRRRVFGIDLVILELAPGIVIEEGYKCHEIRMVGVELPETVMHAAIGENVSSMISHPALIDPRLTIRRVRRFKKMTKVIIEKPTGPLADRPDGLTDAMDSALRRSI